MLTKNELKYIQSLYHKKQRDEAGFFIAEGPKLAEELIKSEYEIKHIYAIEKWINKHPGIQQPVTEISEIELERISLLQTPNEVVVVAKQSVPVQPPLFKDKLVLVLDGIQDPGNMGTMIRIADWFGITQLVCSHDSVEKYNPKVVQASMGSITRVSCSYLDFDKWEIPPELPVFGAMLTGANIFKLDTVREGLLVIGNESKGIREPLRSKITRPVTIPKIGEAESLNAAVATGIILGCFLNGNN